MVKQVIIIPSYLGMSPGKVASQACHAAVKAVLGGIVPEKRIILKADSTDQLNALWRLAGQFKLERFRIVDEGRTEVEPHSVTAVSFIGSEKNVDKVTGSLQLL